MRVFSTILCFVFFAATVCSQPVVAKKHFQLFLLAGQSNMAGRGVVEANDKQTHPRIWVLNKHNEWQLAAEPLHFDKPGVTGVGPGLAFARQLLATDSNLVIGLIPCAVGGSPIEVWQPGKFYEPTKCYPYDDAVKRMKIAGQYGTFKGILWQQGESDCDSIRAKIYGDNLVALVKRFRKQIHLKSLPFFAGTIAEFYTKSHPYGKIINQAIAGVPSKLKHTMVVDAAGLTPNADNIHFNNISARELGKRFAKGYISFVEPKAERRKNKKLSTK